MFDYWESDIVNPESDGLKSFDQVADVQNKIKLVTKRIRKFDPLLANRVQEVALSIASNISEYIDTQNDLPTIDDAQPKVTPQQANCFIEQFAIQWKEPDTHQRRFVISSKLYNHVVTNDSTRAGLILHESIYRYAIENGVTNSDKIRYFNYLTSTSKFDNTPTTHTEDYLNAINNAGLNFLNCKKVKFLEDKVYAFMNPHNTINDFCLNQSIALSSDSLITYYQTDPVSSSNKKIYSRIINGRWLDFPVSYALPFVSSQQSNKTYGFNIFFNNPAIVELSELFIIPSSKVGNIYCTGSQVTLTLDNQTLGCSLNPKTSYRLGNSIYSFISASPNLDDYSNPFIMVNGTETQGTFILAGKKHQMKIESKNLDIDYLTVNPNLEIQNLKTRQKFSLNIGNTTYKNVYGLYFDKYHNNELFFKTQEKINQFTGLPLINSGNIQDLKDFCSQSGLNSNEIPITELQSTYVESETIFYDIGKMKNTTKVDEYVDVFNSIVCTENKQIFDF